MVLSVAQIIVLTGTKKSKLSLSMPWQYRRSRGIAPLLHPSSGWRWVVNFMPWPLYPWGKKRWQPLNRRPGGPQNQPECSLGHWLHHPGSGVEWHIQWIMNWKGRGRKWLRPSCRYWPGIYLKGLRKLWKPWGKLVSQLRFDMGTPEIKVRSFTGWALHLFR